MTNTESERPEFLTDEHLEYLDDLRESGQTNMFGAGQWVQEAFGVDRKSSQAIVLYWMKTFSQRNKEEQ